jgi:hypothetical protein
VPNRSSEPWRRPTASRRSRSALLAAIIGLTMTVLATTTASAASPVGSSTTDEAACTGHWPASVQGKPSMYQAGARAGDYLWHDSRGWHLRVTKVTSEKAVFSGRIRSDKPLSVTGVALEPGDTFTLSADKLTLTYRFANYGHIDGLDFRTACANRLGFAGYMNGTLLPTSRIWIGANGRHPLQNPFVVTRVH